MASCTVLRTTWEVKSYARRAYFLACRVAASDYVLFLSAVVSYIDGNGDAMHLPRGCFAICTSPDITPVLDLKVP